MPFTYNGLVTAFRWKRGEILNTALHTKGGGTTQGPSSLFCNALFCVLEREFRSSPNKKKAMLIFEMFLAENYETNDFQYRKQFIPTGVVWPTALQMNVEADGGVTRSKFRKIQNGIASIAGVYASGQSLSDKNRRKTSHTRKFKAIGGQAKPDMFAPVVDRAKLTIPQIGKSGIEPSIQGVIAKSIFNHRGSIQNAIIRAGFNADAVGIKKLAP